MTLDELIPYLGYSERNAEFALLMAERGKPFTSFSRRDLRTQGMFGIELPTLGLALTFEGRNGYESHYALPKDDGEFIFAGVFAYPGGSKTVRPYTGPVPFAKTPITSRADALREFGQPDETEIDDGVLDWDQWIKKGLQVRTTYRADSSLSNISISSRYTHAG